MTDQPDDPTGGRLPEILGETTRWTASEAEIAHIREFWTDLGIHRSATALRFVEEFNGIQFRYPRHPLDPGTHVCELNAERAGRIVNGEKLRAYEERAGEPLTPVGLAASSHLVLLVAEGGRTYGAYDAFLARYGESPQEALEHIVDRVPPVRLD